MENLSNKKNFNVISRCKKESGKIIFCSNFESYFNNENQNYLVIGENVFSKSDQEIINFCPFCGVYIRS